jgi:hypothetical protein
MMRSLARQPSEMWRTAFAAPSSQALCVGRIRESSDGARVHREPGSVDRTRAGRRAIRARRSLGPSSSPAKRMACRGLWWLILQAAPVRPHRRGRPDRDHSGRPRAEHRAAVLDYEADTALAQDDVLPGAHAPSDGRRRLLSAPAEKGSRLTDDEGVQSHMRPLRFPGLRYRSPEVVIFEAGVACGSKVLGCQSTAAMPRFPYARCGVIVPGAWLSLRHDVVRHNSERSDRLRVVYARRPAPLFSSCAWGKRIGISTSVSLSRSNRDGGRSWWRSRTHIVPISVSTSPSARA